MQFSEIKSLENIHWNNLLLAYRAVSFHSYSSPSLKQSSSISVKRSWGMCSSSSSVPRINCTRWDGVSGRKWESQQLKELASMMQETKCNTWISWTQLETCSTIFSSRGHRNNRNMDISLKGGPFKNLLCFCKQNNIWKFMFAFW